MSSIALKSSDGLPAQINWSEEEYLAFDENKLVEFSDGRVEVLDMPTTAHQLLVAFLYGALLAHSSPKRLGRPLFAPLKMRLWPGTYREPDIIFMLQENAGRIQNAFWDRADLVME